MRVKIEIYNYWMNFFINFKTSYNSVQQPLALLFRMQALQQLFLVAGTAALEERMSSSSCSVTFPLIAVQRSVSNYETSTTEGELPRLCSPCLPHTHSLAFMSIKFLWYRHLCVLFISASAIPPPPISPPCDFPTSWFALSYSLCTVYWNLALFFTFEG